MWRVIDFFVYQGVTRLEVIVKVTPENWGIAFNWGITINWGIALNCGITLNWGITLNCCAQ